jgi:hypothetical protein
LAGQILASKVSFLARLRIHSLGPEADVDSGLIPVFCARSIGRTHSSACAST